ncbi:TPA: hypothetical protein ACLAP9_001942, partial [Neisseria meningitidis]
EQENITFTADIKKPLSLGCQRGMLRKLMRPFDRAHHIRRESGSFGFGHFQQIPVALRCWFPAFVEMAAEGFCFPTNIYVYRMKFHRPHKNAR